MLKFKNVLNVLYNLKCVDYFTQSSETVHFGFMLKLLFCRYLED